MKFAILSDTHLIILPQQEDQSIKKRKGRIFRGVLTEWHQFIFKINN